MGERGPNSRPATVHQLYGNPSKQSAAQLMDSLQPEIDIPDMPRHLLPEAQAEAARILPQLKRYGLISVIDRASICLYLQSWAELVYAETQMKIRAEECEMARWECEQRGEPYLGGDAIVEITTNGNKIYSPHWVAANKARLQVNKFLANFGMSPASRGRVNPSNHLQRELFDDGDGEPREEGFGSI